MSVNLDSKRIVLSTLEHVSDITDPKTPFEGTFSLMRYQDNFYFHWIKLDGSLSQYITAVYDYCKEIDLDVWENNGTFTFDCAKSDFLEFEEPMSFHLSRVDKQGHRSFSIHPNEALSLRHFVSQLIVNGIVVPSSKSQYSFEFYHAGHRGTYPFTPSHIQLAIRPQFSLPVFWDDVHNYFESLILHLDSSGTLPQDPSFPINMAAKAAHTRVQKMISEHVGTFELYTPITSAEFSSLFDESGKLFEPESFRLRIFHCGVEDSLLPSIIPYAVGLYPLDSTQKDREDVFNNLMKTYKSLEIQLNNLSKEQIANNEKFVSSFRVIDHDVSRTDRTIKAFINPNGVGLTMLTKMLRLFVLYNPPIGYLQGMNDLFVPFILAFFPNWTESGDPIDADNNVIDHTPIMPLIFWCFESMLRNTNQIKLLESVTEHCKDQAIFIHEILSKVSPLAALWMRKNQLQGLLWCYSDFVLMFKRSFDNIWPTWLQFNLAKNSVKFLSYFVAAVLIESYNQFALMPEVTITAMMDSFPKILKTIDAARIGNTAVYLSTVYPSLNTLPKAPVPVSLDFFFIKD